MQLEEAMQRLNEQLAHAWMVRTFLKHADEVQEDEALLTVPRMIFDYIRALEKSYQNKDAKDYFSRAQRKLSKLKAVARTLAAEHARVSSHTNFQMAALSLSTCVREIETILQAVRPLLYPAVQSPDSPTSASEPSP